MSSGSGPDVSDSDQQRVFAFLADPGTHGLVGQEVKRVRTHVAEVFLAKDRVYKVKRAVRYAFVDFSSIEARRLACEAELRLNSRTAPDIYLGTSAIREMRDGTLVLDDDGGGEGDAVEWAVRMVNNGAGEILLTSMDRDGTKNGFDLGVTRAIADAVTVPVIASGGVGNLQHLVDGVTLGGADAVLAASIFHFGEYTIPQAKAYMRERGIEVRL